MTWERRATRQSMIPKSGHRFSEQIMLKQTALDLGRSAEWRQFCEAHADELAAVPRELAGPVRSAELREFQNEFAALEVDALGWRVEVQLGAGVRHIDDRAGHLPG